MNQKKFFHVTLPLIILVCLLFMLSIHLPSYISVHALSYSVIIINQSIHINLLAGAQNITGTQNITGANIIIMLVCRWLLTIHLPRKAAV